MLLFSVVFLSESNIYLFYSLIICFLLCRNFIVADDLEASLCGWQVVIQNEFTNDSQISSYECNGLLRKFYLQFKYVAVKKKKGSAGVWKSCPVAKFSVGKRWACNYAEQQF